MKYTKKIKNTQEEARMVLRKLHKEMKWEMKWQADKERKKAEVWKKSKKVILSMKDLIFKERLVRKLVDWYISSYINVSQVIKYREPVKEQNVEEVML